MATHTLVGEAIDEEEAAAALAALACLLEEEAAAVVARPERRPAGWRDAAKLIAQGLVPTRLPALPSWGSIERLRRAGRGGSGVVGQ